MPPKFYLSCKSLVYLTFCYITTLNYEASVDRSSCFTKQFWDGIHSIIFCIQFELYINSPPSLYFARFNQLYTCAPYLLSAIAIGRTDGPLIKSMCVNSVCSQCLWSCTIRVQLSLRIAFDNVCCMERRPVAIIVYIISVWKRLVTSTVLECSFSVGLYTS